MTKNQRPKLIVISGPTASGKSNLGIKLAKKFNGEIISADSRQVYRGMNIGTGKITKKEQQLVKHHLIDVTNPKKIFSVSDFKKLGEKAIKEILNKNKIPFIVGGSGFYIDALVKNISLPEVPANKKLRKKLEKRTAEDLFRELERLDDARSKTIDYKNKRRLIRALEIIDSIGKVPYLDTKHGPHDTKYNVLWLGLRPKNIDKKIKLRLDRRLKQGMIKEAKNLLAQGISKKRLYDFGLEYKWVSEYLDKKNNYSEMKSGLLRDILRYSKRQMTWFKRNKEIHWVKKQREAEKLIRKFISPLP